MTTRPQKVHTQLGPAAVQIFAVNDRINQILIERLDPAAWRAKPPGQVRTIAAIFTHMHNVRSKWVRLTAPHLKVPPQLNRAHCTPQQARAGLAESAARCAEMLAEALAGCEGRVEKFRRDGWAQPWPVGPEMLCYMLCHEAHHRGQVCMLAHQLGFPLANEVAYGLWNWEKLWKECGSPAGPGYVQSRSGNQLPMLIIFGGLPGVGKTAIAAELARLTGAVHLRIDSIEQAIRASGIVNQPLDDAGYRVAYAIAEDNLRIGRTAIADSVNPVQVTREAWTAVAKRARVRAIEVEIECSDVDEHRRRVETRTTDIPGLQLPTWEEVVGREYDPWHGEHLVIDTAGRSVEQNVDAIRQVLRDDVRR